MAAADEPPLQKPRVELGEELPSEVSEQDIKHMLDQADDLHIETLNESALKRMVLQLERKIKSNQALRIKHVDEPDKWLKSEVDLDEEVKRFSMLTTHPDLYGEFVKLDALPQLIGLLNHTNTDIAVDVFEVLSELTDPDVIAEVEEPEAFVAEVFKAQLPQMAVDVLLRIDEDASEEDAKAVTNCLTMIENLAEINPAETCNQFAEVSKFLPWLIKRVRAQGAVDYNRVYASEILGIVLQNSGAAREAMLRLEGVDKVLRGIAGYRKRDPADNEEAEFVQNMFDCLCSLMLLPAHQLAFGKVQGLELMVRMMSQQVFASRLALRLADHALRHCPVNCQIFVDKLGLKTLFPLFMKRGVKIKSKADTKEVEEHVTSIIQSLCRYCTGTAVARLLNKFMEGNFEKLERLMEMHEECILAVREADSARMQGQVQKIDRELQLDGEEQLFLDRCDAGLFTLQQIDIILVRLSNMGNRQATDEIGKLLNIKGVPLEEVCDIIEEYCSHLDDSASAEQQELRGAARTLVRRFAADADAAEALERRLGAERHESGRGEAEAAKGGSKEEKKSKAEKKDKTDKAEKKENTDKAEKKDKPDKAEKKEKTDKAEKKENTDKKGEKRPRE